MKISKNELKSQIFDSILPFNGSLKKNRMSHQKKILI